MYYILTNYILSHYGKDDVENCTLRGSAVTPLALVVVLCRACAVLCCADLLDPG